MHRSFLCLVPHPYTVSGRRFTGRSAVILKAIARSRDYTDALWVPMQMADPLGLALDVEAEHAVRLDAMNGTCFYYHCSQFGHSPDEIRKRWDLWQGSRLPTTASAKTTDPRAFPQQLTTNGETLSGDATAQLRARFTAGERWGTPYWATEAEAEHIFDAPFLRDYASQTCKAIHIANPFAPPQGLLYFNVEGTVRPTQFTSVTCARYDPYNYNGEFYSAAVSIAMKRLAVRHKCLHCRRWMTPERIHRFGGALLPTAEPLLIMVENKLLSLVNLAQTDRPTYLEAAAVNARPMGDVNTDPEAHLEQSLLLTTVEDVDGLLLLPEIDTDALDKNLASFTGTLDG